MPELVIGADVSFFVPGLASPGGSKRAFLSKSGKIVVKDDAANNRPWRYHTGRKAGQVKQTAPHYHTTKPDATKLLRALEDALKLICWNDDSQVARQRVDKVYQGATAGAFVSIWRLAAREVA
jgi:Holliday junction resolvase RusA-like endonuclease